MSCCQTKITNTKSVRGRRIHSDSFDVKLTCPRDKIHSIFRTAALKHPWFQNEEIKQYLSTMETDDAGLLPGSISTFEMEVTETIWYSDEHADLTIHSNPAPHVPD